MTPHRSDVLCAICEEEFQMYKAKALYEAQEAAFLMHQERAKHAKYN